MDQLFDEVLLEIFSYCGKYENISQTCKRFYNLVCTLKRNKYVVNINPEMLYDEETYNSIMNSQKVFDKLRVNCMKLLFEVESIDYSIGFYEKMKKILELKGVNIKILIWAWYESDADYFFEILSFLPNVENLWFSCMSINESNKSVSGTLNLFHLKNLTVIMNDSAPSFFAHHLPHNILTSLWISHHIPQLLRNQQSIRNLKLEETLSNEWSPIASLTKLELGSDNFTQSGMNERKVDSSTIFKHQPDLEELIIKDYNKAINGNNEAFENLCSLKKLKVLAINIQDLLHVSLDANFSKLKMLEELEISGWINDADTKLISDAMLEISYMKFENLRKLDIGNIDCIKMDHVKQMGKNYPRLNHLKLFSKLPLTVDVFLDHFKSLTSLTVVYEPKRELSIVCSKLDKKVYPNITSLKLDHVEFDDYSYWFNINKLKKSMPKIEELSCKRRSNHYGQIYVGESIHMP